jgi:hypothetical protein
MWNNLSFEKQALVIITGTVIFFIVLFGWAYNCNTKFFEEVEHWREQCESHGGLLLDRTYTVGAGKTRTTEHKFTCVKKEMVIEYDFEH